MAERGERSKRTIATVDVMSHVRRMTMLHVLVLAGCSPGARSASAPAPLFVPPLSGPTVAADPVAVRFAEGAAPPSGCFAVSRRTGAVACALGQFGVGTTRGERYLSLLQSSDEALPFVPIRVQAAEGGLKLERQSQRTLDAIMREGDYIALGAPVAVPLESPRTFGELTVELRRASNSLSEELPPGAGIFDLKVIVQVDGRPEQNEGVVEKGDVLLENTLTSVACLSPSLTVRVLEPKVVLIERECRLDDLAEPEVVVGAWLCDSERARCD